MSNTMPSNASPVDLSAYTVCTHCTISCSDCNAATDMSSSAICDLCHDVICSECICEVTNCKCCQHMLPPSQHGIICVSCTSLHWFSPSKCAGFWCTACEEHCTEETCRVRAVKASQKSCPICLEELDENNYVPQLCEIHGVCKECHYDTNLGCPLCRVGKS